MNRLEKWFFKRILRKEVRQSYDHGRRISELYGLVRQACEQEFFEDNAPTMDANLRIWFEASQSDKAPLELPEGMRLIEECSPEGTLSSLAQSFPGLLDFLSGLKRLSAALPGSYNISDHGYDNFDEDTPHRGVALEGYKLGFEVRPVPQALTLMVMEGELPSDLLQQAVKLRTPT